MKRLSIQSFKNGDFFFLLCVYREQILTTKFLNLFINTVDDNMFVYVQKLVDFCRL